MPILARNALNGISNMNSTIQHGSQTTAAEAQPVTGRSAFWALAALALNAMVQTSFSLTFLLKSGGTVAGTLSPHRSSPLISLLDAVFEMAILLKTGAFWMLSLVGGKQETDSRVLAKVDKTRRLFGPDPNDREERDGFQETNGVKPMSPRQTSVDHGEKKEQPTSESANSKTSRAALSLKIGLFVLGALPQAIKLFSMRGIPVTQCCAAAFLLASVLQAVNSALRRHNCMETLQVMFWTARTRWRLLLLLLLGMGHAARYIWIWRRITDRITIPVTEASDSLIDNLEWPRLGLNIIFVTFVMLWAVVCLCWPRSSTQSSLVGLAQRHWVQWIHATFWITRWLLGVPRGIKDRQNDKIVNGWEHGNPVLVKREVQRILSTYPDSDQSTCAENAECLYNLVKLATENVVKHNKLVQRDWFLKWQDDTAYLWTVAVLGILFSLGIAWLLDHSAQWALGDTDIAEDETSRSHSKDKTAGAALEVPSEPVALSQWCERWLNAEVSRSALLAIITNSDDAEACSGSPSSNAPHNRKNGRADEPNSTAGVLKFGPNLALSMRTTWGKTLERIQHSWSDSRQDDVCTKLLRCIRVVLVGLASMLGLFLAFLMAVAMVTVPFYAIDVSMRRAGRISAEVFWLAFAIFNLLTTMSYYLIAFDGVGTVNPGWTSILGWRSQWRVLSEGWVKQGRQSLLSFDL